VRSLPSKRHAPWPALQALTTTTRESTMAGSYTPPAFQSPIYPTHPRRNGRSTCNLRRFFLLAHRGIAAWHRAHTALEAR
jgi:hypothetical protein